MSTPSTATATHPTHHQQHYGYPHHPPYQPNPPYPTTTAAATSRLATTYPYAVNPATATLPFTQSPKIVSAALTPATTTATMPPTHNGVSASAAPTQTGRRKKPDWGEFYKNGIPKEVIVIDDTPPPEQSKGSARSFATTSTVTATSNGNLPQPAGKKRRTGVESAYDVTYYDRPSFSINPQHYGEDSSAASISTDRTTSLHTTAPTSLSQGSSGASNGVYYEDANIGQKRKRVTTRKSARDEQKRRELENAGDAFLNYIPPPKPIIKAKDVPVPVVRDVSGSYTFLHYFPSRRILTRCSTQTEEKSTMTMMVIIL